MPPASWFSLFIAEDNAVELEQFENFPKQTYRNRANIYGANGKLSLIIPINHTGRRTLKDIEISYRENWQKLHFKSIKTAYQSSPYFEFYEDQLAKIFEGQVKFLLDLNLRTLEVINTLLKTQKVYHLTEEYVKNPSATDLRQEFSAKDGSAYQCAPYHQVFTDKYGFLEDLSIVDIICNLGPETLTYLKNITPKQQI